MMLKRSVTATAIAERFMIPILLRHNSILSTLFNNLKYGPSLAILESILSIAETDLSET